MPLEIVRKLTPEEEELQRKREELASIRVVLAQRELELADFRAELKAFEGLYLRTVGVLYAELDEWDAKIAELEARLEGSKAARERADRARRRASETHEATHGEAARTPEFKPSQDLKNLFRETAKRVHPDFARDDADRERRTRLMTEANEAFSRGDAEALNRILDEFAGERESIPGESIGAELIRVIRQIAEAKKRIAKIEKDVSDLQSSELAKLREDVQASELRGRNLLSELAAKLAAQVTRAREEFGAMKEQKVRNG